MSVMVSVSVSQVGMTELIFVNPGVKVKGQYYCNVLLSQQMLPAIKRVAKRCLFTRQYVAYIHTYINTYMKFITRCIVEDCSNQRRGLLLGGGV